MEAGFGYIKTFKRKTPDNKSKKVSSHSLRSREDTLTLTKISGFVLHTGIQRNTIPCRIGKNAPPANMRNLGFRHESLATEGLDLCEGSINIVCRDIDEQAISL